MVTNELLKQLFKMVCNTPVYMFTSDELSYFDAMLYIVQGYVTYVGVNLLQF